MKRGKLPINYLQFGLEPSPNLNALTLMSANCQPIAQQVRIYADILAAFAACGASLVRHRTFTLTTNLTL
jgi:hypothetical protein